MSKVHLQAYRNSLRQVLRLLSPPRALEIDFPCPGPRRQIAHLLFHYLSPSLPDSYSSLNANTRIEWKNVHTHLSRSLIVKLSVLTERERERTISKGISFLSIENWIKKKALFRKRKRKCSLNKFDRRRKEQWLIIILPPLMEGMVNV